MKHNQTFPKDSICGNKCESILFSILFLIGSIPWSESQKGRRGRPYVYSPTVILRCFIVRLWFRLDSNNALHEFLELDYPYNKKKIMKRCGLTQIPDRRTFDRRLKTISIDIKKRITVMTCMFVYEKIDKSIHCCNRYYFTESQRTCLAQIIYEQRYSTMFWHRY